MCPRNIKAHIKGVVYIFQFEGCHHVKIGYSAKPKQRLRSLLIEAGAPSKFRFEEFASDSSFWVEQEVHSQLGDFHIDGEWFDVDFKFACEAVTEVCLALEPLISLKVRNYELEHDNNSLKRKLEAFEENKIFIITSNKEKHLSQNAKEELVELAYHYGELCERLAFPVPSEHDELVDKDFIIVNDYRNGSFASWHKSFLRKVELMRGEYVG